MSSWPDNDAPYRFETDGVSVVVSRYCLRWLAVETVANLTRRCGFFASAIEKLTRNPAERALRGRGFLPAFGKRRFNADCIAEGLIFVL
jgi:hypothetical protein